MLLAAEWQGFCRELHSEAVDAIADEASPASLRRPIRTAFTFSNFWPRLEALDRRNVGRRLRLRQLYAWRNAIAHHDVARINRDLTADSRPNLAWARTWRAACDQLAHQADRVVMAHIATLVGVPPLLGLARAA